MSVSVVAAAMFIGMVTMAVRVSIESRNQRSAQVSSLMDSREALDTIERLLSHAVEVSEWDASTNTPTISSNTSEAGDSYVCRVAGTQNLGGGPAITCGVGDVITHDGTGWAVNARAPNGTWNPTTNSPDITSSSTGSLYDTWRVQGAGPGPWANKPTFTQLAAPTGGWMPGDLITKFRNTGSPTTFRWRWGSWRADINFPSMSDLTGPPNGTMGISYAVNIPRPVSPPPPPLPIWTPTASRNMGSGLMPFVTGDRIVRTPGGWRKLGWQNSVRNFESANTKAEDNVSGIHFYADVDPDNDNTDISWTPFPTPIRRKVLEWVWIWWDKSLDLDQSVRPYERRGALKIAIFRARPYGGTNDSHDTWTGPNHPFFNRVNSPAANGRKPYFTTAANFGALSMKVQSFTAPLQNLQGFVWHKRVAISGGAFLDRTQDLAALGSDPWADVAPGFDPHCNPSGPGLPYTAPYTARFTNVPSYTISRSIYLDNAGATQDANGRPFTFSPNQSSNYGRIARRWCVGWQTRTDTTTIKNDAVVQPR